jgi:hypothetical protein
MEAIAASLMYQANAMMAESLLQAFNAAYQRGEIALETDLREWIIIQMTENNDHLGDLYEATQRILANRR